MAAQKLTPLTGEQQLAIEQCGNLLLTACPGSGKTRTLVAKLVRELEGVRGSPRAVCCITYTNTAVDEIRLRVREQASAEDSDHIFVSTIHSFCLNEVLRQFGWLRPGYDGNAQVLTRDDPHFEEIVRAAAAEVNFLNLQARDFEAFEGIALDAGGNLVGLATKNEAVKRAAPHFLRICRERGYIDFGTIVYEAYCVLRDNYMVARALGARYAWFLVDEFQDTSELQIEILRLLHLAGRSHFFLVGDLVQSIYSFAGARPELVEPFAIAIGARTDLSLSGNFRSSASIVEYSNRLFSRQPEMTAEGVEKNTRVAPVLVRDRSTFAAVLECFLPMLAAAGIGFGDAIVLCREWGPLVPIARGLRDAGIPVVGPGARPYKRSRLFASLAEQLGAAVVDPSPHTATQVEIALVRAVRDVTESARRSITSTDARLAIVRLLRAAEKAAESGAAVKFLDILSLDTGRILRDLELIDDRQAGRFYASAQEMKADVVRQGGDLESMSVTDLGLFASENRALRLATVHYAKGREYKGVAIIDVSQGKFPHYYSNTDAAVAEDKRLLYVAMTRAERVLMFVSAPDRFGNGPSPFLGRGGLNML